MRHLEDLAAGERFVTQTAVVTEAEIITFARQFDPQPMHVDPERAVAGPLGAIAASGWHTISVVMRLIVEADPLDGAPWLGLGVDEVRWPNPVRPGDSIQAELEIVSITPSRSKPTHGVVRIKITARNQKGEVVVTMFPNLWVARRPSGD
jgi:acyl dehydratase